MTAAPAPAAAGPRPAGPPPVERVALPLARVASGGVRMLAGVPYAGLPGARPIELDLWLPPETSDVTEGRCPAVVFLHGGGWRLGSRHGAGPAYAGVSPHPFELVAQAGIAVASVDYRLSGEATFPAQLHDAKAAVRWLRARAGEIGVDAERIAAWGESAGGHLALLLGLTGTDADLEGSVGVPGSSAVAAVVAWYAPSDILSLPGDLGADPHDGGSREAMLLGAPAATVPERAAQAGPISHVCADAPPTLLLHGRADRAIPAVQSERLHRALVAAGADAGLHLYDGADHMWLGSEPAAADAVTRTIGFLHHHLSGERS